MKNKMQLCWLLIAAFLVSATLSFGQAPTGSIGGTVYDETGAVIANALVVVKNKATGVERRLASGADGTFLAASLPAGEYEVRTEMKGFRTQVREATVQVGATTTADSRMTLGQAAEIVNVEAATTQISYDSNTIEGVITRQKIQDLPLNGRSFLNLASLEPGVTVGTGSTSQYNALFSVSILGGSSSRTSINVDGGNIRNQIEGGTSQNFSQEVVQEFQLSSVNFDLSTGITSVGSINVVTRSGGNDFHGSAYFFFRDHNMAAYPGLTRNPLNLDPFFARRNPGFWLGGPIVKNKLFFFFNLENTNQTQVYTYQSNLASASSLTGNYFSPYKGRTLSARFDYKLSANHTLFARYSHDGNQGFGPSGSNATLPSNWLRNTNWADQTALGVTSTLKSNLVNDFRFIYGYWQNRNLFPTDDICKGCLGLLGPQIGIANTNVTIGDTSNATQGRDLRRFQFTDSMNWQKGSHRIRFGGEFEHAPGTGFWGFCDPYCTSVVSPEAIRAAGLGAAVGLFFPTLPTTIKTIDDFNNLPFAGAIVGIGDPAQPPPYNVDKAKLNRRVRFYGQDSWRISPKFTLNYGLAWEYESNIVNGDIDKPKYLAPLYGSDLSSTKNNPHNFSPSVGFTWNPFHDQKTVIRGGAGIYYDTENLSRRLQERASIGPVGNGRQQIPNTVFTNIFPGIVDISRGGVAVPVGASVPYGDVLNLTLGQFRQIYAQQAAAVAAALAPKNLNDLSVRNIDISKAGTDLYLRNFPVQNSTHLNLGVQREIRRDLVVTVDFARRIFAHIADEYDFNRYNRYINGVQSPIIPKCTGTQASIPGFSCSSGPIVFWDAFERSVYSSMLVKVDKRFSQRYQFTASYALSSQHGYNGLYNYDQLNSSWGPQGSRHILNISGTADLKWGFQLGLISSTSSVGPTMAYVSQVDLTGSGVTTTPLPGLSFNCINRGCGASELTAAVANWNTTYAGKKDARGATIPSLVLPSSFTFGRPGNSQDVRLTKTFTYREHYKLSILGEVFNVLNYANKGGYSNQLDKVVASNQTFSFGQATSRGGQVFGSGGPRAFQVGARFQF
jgi:hypothetical protein